MTLLCEGVSRAFGGTRAITDVSFAMEAGETLAMIGPNGAGKSTTLGVLTTALRPDSGRVAVCGHDAGTAPEAVRAEIGVLFQDPALDPALTPRETLHLHAALHGMTRRVGRRATEESLAWAELSDVADRPVRAFSGGMKRRLELARALMHAPKLLVLDEPTLGLDPAGQRDLWARIDRLRDSGLSVLLVTHVLSEAARSDRVAVMAGGRLAAIGTPAELKCRHATGPEASLEDVLFAVTGRGPREERGRAPMLRSVGGTAV